LAPLPEKLDPEVARRSVEIARQVMSEGRKEIMEEEIRKREDGLRALKEAYAKEFGGCDETHE